VLIIAILEKLRWTKGRRSLSVPTLRFDFSITTWDRIATANRKKLKVIDARECSASTNLHHAKSVNTAGRAMSLENPYQAPQSTDVYPESIVITVDDDYPRNLKWLLFSFRGRIPRRMFWLMTIVAWVSLFGSVYVGAIWIPEEVLQFLVILPVVIFIWVSLAIQVKRWHDRAKSGWWILVGLVPVIGPIWATAETGFCRGTFGFNQYGRDPT
jgi:uncharacterized membrane protein YhaH (DUF805 family)